MIASPKQFRTPPHPYLSRTRSGYDTRQKQHVNSRWTGFIPSKSDGEDRRSTVKLNSLVFRAALGILAVKCECVNTCVCVHARLSILMYTCICVCVRACVRARVFDHEDNIHVE